MNRSHLFLVSALSFGYGILATSIAGAASLQKVEQSEWHGGKTDLPSYVNMYLYVPDAVADVAPIVVAPHHCQGTGPGTYNEMRSLVTIADRVGFIMIFPEATGQNCWDAGSSRSLSHTGAGDTGAIVQMVDFVVGSRGADAQRVYAVGGSSGGIMTEALLGVYPDVFLAGVSYMGVPCGCWATGYNDVVGNGGTAQWSACAGGNVTKSSQEWGDLVRSYYPGYTGHRPRLQHWHGENDTVIHYKNHAEDIKEWPNVLGLEAAPTGTDMPQNGVTRQFWKNECGFTVYEAFSMSGVAHNVPFDGQAVATYFGLGAAGDPDPELETCGDGMAGTGGAASGSGGAETGGTDSGVGGTDAGGSAGVGGASVGGLTSAGGFASVGVGGGLGTGGGSVGASGGSGSVSEDGIPADGCACSVVGRQSSPTRGAMIVLLGVGAALLGRLRRAS